MPNIGIVDIGIKVPFNRIKYEEIISTWGNSHPMLLESTVGIKSRGVTDYDEDIITLAVESLADMRNLLDIPNIDSLYFGTTSQVDLVRPNSMLLKQSIGIKDDALISDVSFSEKSGTTALINSLISLENKRFNNSLVVSADTLNMYTAPGDLRETYMGAAGSSVLLGKENTIFDFLDYQCDNTYFPSDFKPYDERFIRSGLPLGSEKTKYGEMIHFKCAIQGLLDKNNLEIGDISKFIFPSMPISVSHILQIELQLEDNQYIKTDLFPNLGNTGSPSPIIELKKTLTHLKKDKLIVLLGYGSGAGADAILLKTTDRIENYSKDIDFIDENEFKLINYAESLKLEEKLVSTNIKHGPFL